EVVDLLGLLEALQHGLLGGVALQGLFVGTVGSQPQGTAQRKTVSVQRNHLDLPSAGRQRVIPLVVSYADVHREQSRSYPVLIAQSPERGRRRVNVAISDAV